jgi:hypothetical protein
MRYKQKIPAHIEEQVKGTRTLCDGCGRDVDHADDMYHSEEATISAIIGAVCADYDSRTAYDVDVCGACFVSKVVPALAALGIRVRTRDVDGRDDGREWEPEAPNKEST